MDPNKMRAAVLEALDEVREFDAWCIILSLTPRLEFSSERTMTSRRVEIEVTFSKAGTDYHTLVSGDVAEDTDLAVVIKSIHTQANQTFRREFGDRYGQMMAGTL